MEITRSYRSTQTEMSKIEKTEDTKCWPECGRTKSRVISCGNEQMRRPRVCKAVLSVLPPYLAEATHKCFLLANQTSALVVLLLLFNSRKNNSGDQDPHRRSHHRFTVLVPEPRSQHPFF